jgi:hypothetical protein
MPARRLGGGLRKSTRVYGRPRYRKSTTETPKTLLNAKLPVIQSETRERERERERERNRAL